MNTQIS